MGCVASRIFPVESKPYKIIGNFKNHFMKEYHTKWKDDYEDKKKPDDKKDNPNVLRGDVSLKLEAKIKREKTMHDRMISRTYQAEEMSGKIMEERERLSLGTRSRATSGASTPVHGNSSRRSVHFKSDSNGDVTGPKKGGIVKKSLQNTSDETITISIAGMHSNQSIQSSGNKQPIDKNVSQTLTNDQQDKDLQSSVKSEKLTTIEERTSSRASGLSGSESKRG